MTGKKTFKFLLMILIEKFLHELCIIPLSFNKILESPHSPKTFDHVIEFSSPSYSTISIFNLLVQ